MLDRLSPLKQGMRLGRLTRAISVSLLLLLSLWLPGVGTVERLDSQLIDFRAANAPRAASDRFVYLAIDKESLDHVGTWPWPRSIHAEIIDRLVAAGAGDILLDIDFSTPSRPAEDQALSAALIRAGGGVILPVFLQRQNVDNPFSATITKPIPEFAENAWLAAADASLTEAGQFRAFDTFRGMNDENFTSVAVVLSALPEAGLPEQIGIDFSIRPDTVRVISVADLLRNKVSADMLAGRSVVVGAYSTELKDQFPVPIYGILSGPMLHILAAETLLQDRVPQPLVSWPIYLITGLLVIAATIWRRLTSIPVVAAIAVVISVASELAAYFLQKQWSLILPTATIHLILALGFTALLAAKLDLTTLLAELASAEKRNSRRILKRIIQDSVDAVFIVNDQGTIIDLSRTAGSLSCSSWEPRRGSDFCEGAPAVLVAALRRSIAAFTEGNRNAPAIQEEFDLVCDGQKKHVEAVLTLSSLEQSGSGSDEGHGRSYAACITMRDITARKVYEAKLRRLSQLDDLTGALNRRELINRIRESAEEEKTLAVFAIDLHRFSTVNATLGRYTGDQVLQAVSRRLMAAARNISEVPDVGLVGRLGGDVFCVVLAVSADNPLSFYADKIVGVFSKGINCGSSRIDVSVRVGAALASDVAGGPASWIDAAEAALDQAKKVGGAGWAVHTPVEAAAEARTRRLEKDMRPALKRGEFFLVYQPQVDLKTGAIVGAEALIRWQHAELGLVSPMDFIGIAEANGFICDLGRWALEEACREAVHWPSDLTVAVNVSAVQFAGSDVREDVLRALQVTGLPPGRLHVEITESTFALDAKKLLEDMKRLKALGVTIALDDFGTGYSSLSYISDFPFDLIKIDQSFIRRLAEDAASRAIVHAVTGIAAQLGRKVLCEGIEGETERQLLSVMGCQFGQGYHFGRPGPTSQLLALLDQAKPPVGLTA